jgi:hypothetical protein
MARKIKWQDKDIEVRKQFDQEMKKFDVEITRRNNPMKMVQGGDGNLYLCDDSTNEHGDLIAQGCMDYDEIAVTRHG